jgi:hypothetical protein
MTKAAPFGAKSRGGLHDGELHKALGEVEGEAVEISEGSAKHGRLRNQCVSVLGPVGPGRGDIWGSVHEQGRGKCDHIFSA